LLLGLGVPVEQHEGPMSEVAPGWKLRVLLAQALFGDPDILLLDEPTNNLDIHSIRWLEEVLNRRTSTMVIISHDRHFLSSVCTHMADVDYGGIRVYPGNYDDYMEASTLARQQQLNANARAKERIADLEQFVRRFRAHKAKARQATSRMKQIEKLKVEDVKPSSRQYPFIRFLVEPKEKLHRLAVRGGGTDQAVTATMILFEDRSFHRRARRWRSSAPTASARPRCCAHCCRRPSRAGWRQTRER
jgi:ATPase subunit of ABC transporter with duplicated ATPase domains